MGLFDNFNSIKDQQQREKAANDRMIVDKHISEIQSISLKECRERLGDASIKRYYEVMDDIIRTLQDVDASKEDPWYIDEQLTEIIGELKDAVQRRAKNGIEECLKALKYAALARQLKIPAKHDANTYMNTRLEDLKAYRVIIARTKEMDEIDDSKRRQEAHKAQLSEEFEVAKNTAKEFKYDHPSAFKEIDDSVKVYGYDKPFSGDAIVLRNKMNMALDIHDEIEALERQIAINETWIVEARSIISRMHSVLDQKLEKIDEKSLKLASELEEEMIKQMAHLQDVAEEVRKQNKKNHDILKNLAATAAMRKGMMDTMDEFQAMMDEIDMKEVNDAKAKGQMIKEEMENERRKAKILKKLKEQEAENERLKEEAARQVEEILEEQEQNLEDLEEQYDDLYEEEEEELEVN